MRVILLSLILCLCHQSLCDDSIVNTKYGPIQGLVLKEYRLFQGVPFATPPLNDLRWKKAIPPSPWTSVLNCTSFDIGCAQSAHSLDVPTNTSEDCLYLEVYTPPVGKYKEPAAVMVFYHGGDFKEGGESFAILSGRYMASSSNTVVVITNYRLGVFGFAYGKGIDSNNGLEDQRMAIRWVNQNIAAFGGDPGRVTIFGESAGGESVLIHMACPDMDVAKMFHRAIVESGPITINFRYPSSALAQTELLAYELGCSLTDVNCMRAKSTKEVLQAADKAIMPLDFSEIVMEWGPVVTFDSSLPQEPLFAFEKGELLKVPLIIGSNLDDGAIFGMSLVKGMNSFEYVGIVAALFLNPTDVLDILEMYPPSLTGDNSPIISKMLTDFIFLCSSRKVADLAARAGVETYLYQFSHLPPFCFWPEHQSYCCNLVCHGDELPYVFHDTGSPFPWEMNQTDLSLAAAVSAYWTNFAASGTPNSNLAKGIPKWPMYNNSTDLNIQLQWPVTVTKNLNKAKCDIWDKIGYFH